MSFLPFGDRWAAQSPRVCNVGGGAGCGVVTFSLEWSGVPVQVQRRFQVLAECAPRASRAAALLGPTDAAQAPQVQPERRGQVAPQEPHGILGG